jgi:hypothetical protein
VSRPRRLVLARLRPPVVVQLPWARRRHLRLERRSLGLGVTALALLAVVAGGEVLRIVRRTPEHVGGAEAARQTVTVAVEGYRGASPLETRLLNLLMSFTLAFGVVRASTHAIRSRGTFGPFRNVVVGRHHLHHFVPGILLAFLAGGASVLMDDERVDPWLAVPFGVGVALTLDESALLLRLDDVYWTEEGIVSVQITFAALVTLSGTLLVLRALRRGERTVAMASEGAA